MSVKMLWALLPALASAGLLSAGLDLARPPRPEEGPVPAVLVARHAPSGDAPSGLRVHLSPGVGPDLSMHPLPARITGRASPEGAGFAHQWPAFHAEARFEGRAVALSIDDPANRYRLTVDGAEIDLTRVGAGLLRISGLGAGPHLIRLEKLSEKREIGHFGGFFLPAEATALPPPEARPLIEFIGDSDTVGYGNTAPGRECSSEAQYLATDTSRAYGPMTARALGSDYRVIAASGFGLIRNLGGGNDPAIREIYGMALPGQPEAARAPEVAPEVIVIGLGSNDFAVRPDLDEDGEDLLRQRHAFAEGLLEFMRARRAEAPAARIVLLAFGEYGEDLVEAHRIAQAAFAAEGDHADLLILPKLARTACHWHPSLNDHQVISEALTELLEAPPQPSDLPDPARTAPSRRMGGRLLGGLILG